MGRQASPKVYDWLIDLLNTHNIAYITVLLSEIFPGKLAMFPEVDCWIQTSCPRLSIDWGYGFVKPLLTPYEAAVLFEKAPHWNGLDSYPMDFYAKDSLGPWTPNHSEKQVLHR